jgi:hypothetical protein
MSRKVKAQGGCAKDLHFLRNIYLDLIFTAAAQTMNPQYHLSDFSTIRLGLSTEDIQFSI